MKSIKSLLLSATLLLTLPVVALAAELKVKDGDSIQEAVQRAENGDTILVYPGSYKESVYIDKDDITLRGVVIEGEWPVLEGEKIRNDAVLYSGNGITIEWLKIVNYKGNAIMGQSGNNYVIRNNWVIDAGVYGIFPQFGLNGLIEYNVLSGIEDAAIYVGMCDNIDVRHNDVFDSVAGIEIENSRHALVENNYAHNNTAGILAFITPGLPIKTAYDIIIRNNFVVNNNTPNFGAPGSIVSNVPVGTGIIIMAADDVVIEGNIISGNNTAGIIITDLAFITDVATDPESEPNPDNIRIFDNFMINNGQDAITEVKALMLTRMSTTGPDILAVGSAEEDDNCILNKQAYRSYGIKKWGQCDTSSTAETLTYMLPEPAPSRVIENDRDRAEHLYNGICAGCHAYNLRMIGPAAMAVQALYQDNPQGIADYIAKPGKIRSDYPEMPPQDYLSPQMRLSVAEYMLSLQK